MYSLAHASIYLFIYLFTSLQFLITLHYSSPTSTSALVEVVSCVLMLLNQALEKFSMWTIISKNHSYRSYG